MIAEENNVDSILFIYLFLECEAAGTGKVGSFFFFNERWLGFYILIFVYLRF